jgi:uncharacterized protein YidB (DUF937 family)
MGLLDGVMGAVLGGSQAGGGQNPMAAVLGSLLQQHGGLGGLVDALTRGGLGQQVQGWIATGPNPPVSGEQVTQALGHANVAQIAQQLGLDHGQAGNILAQVLPHLIDHLTPNGALPTGAAASQAVHPDVIGSALGALLGKLRA